jgi:hypothetical protein
MKMKTHCELANVCIEILLDVRSIVLGDITRLKEIVKKFLVDAQLDDWVNHLDGEGLIVHSYLFDAEMEICPYEDGAGLFGMRLFLNPKGKKGSARIVAEETSVTKNADSVMADAAWTADAMVRLLSNEMPQTNFIIRASLPVRMPDGIVEWPKPVVLFDCTKRKKKTK